MSENINENTFHVRENIARKANKDGKIIRKSLDYPTLLKNRRYWIYLVSCLSSLSSNLIFFS